MQKIHIRTLIPDIKYGLCYVAEESRRALLAVSALALGIGANTAIFSFTDQVLLRTLPVPNPHQELVVLRSPEPNPERTSSNMSDEAQISSYPMYKDLRERSTFFWAAGVLGMDVNLLRYGTTQSASRELVSGNYFQITTKL